MIRTSWTQAASIEETLALWAAALREVKQRIRPLFGQERVARNAGLFLEGLLGEEQRKTGWMRAEAAGDPGPWRQQAILGRRDWDADALRDIVRDYVIEHLADDDAVLVIDETGFLKQGKASCGVARQYTGSAGKITNCQIGVFAAYVSRHGHALIDRALYLPKEWTDDPDRLEATYVPPGVGFATKPKLATSMIARAVAASVPFKWVAGDTVYGVGDIEQQLRRDARLRHDGGDPPSRQFAAAQKNEPPNHGKTQNIANPSLIRWSIQEVRRIAIRLARKRIQPAHIIAWSLWRRAHQAIAQRAHLKAKWQL